MIRNLKLLSGLILFLFVAVHLTNLAMGVFSLQVADELRPILMAPFTNLIGSALLIGAMLLHTTLGLLALYQRNTLRMSRYDAVQFLSALMIPALLIPHVWGLLAVKQMLDFNPTFLDLFRTFWIDDPVGGLRQVLLVVVVWIHGCIGLFTWLRLYPWWSRASMFAYPLAVAIPVMALLGFVAGGNHILAQEKQKTPESGFTSYNDSESTYVTQEDEPGLKTAPSQSQEKTGNRLNAPEVDKTFAFINRVKWQLITGYLVLIFLVLAARFLRVRSKSDQLEVHYADGQVVKSAVGPSLLELSNMSDIPHASLCRGRGRCGTCRVEILNTENPLPEPGEIEQKTLGITGADSPIRLACQLNPPAGVIKIKRLLPPNVKLPVQLNEIMRPDAVAETASVDPIPQNTTA